MTAGRRSIIALNTVRAVSYAGWSGVMTAPVKSGTTTGVAWVISPPMADAAATGRPRLGVTLLLTPGGAPSQQKAKCGNARAGEHVRDAEPSGRPPASDQPADHGRQHLNPGKAAQADAEQQH